MITQTEDEAVAEDEVILVDKESKFRLGELFLSRKEFGAAGLPVLSVTMNDGLVHRDTLDRKTDGKLAPDEHLLIRKGDLAYNMMRMWQGASGSAKQDGIVSPAYVVVTPSDFIDPTFASYWFKSARMIHLFWAYSYGITGDRLRLYYRDFAKIPVTIPSKSDQIQIGKTLAAADRAIARTEGFIAAKRKLKEGLAWQLITGKCRLPKFDGEWTSVSLGELAVISMGSSPPSSSYNDHSDGLPLIQGNADTSNRRSAPRVWTSVVTTTCDVGDILLSVRAPVGKISISDHNACIGRGMASIQAHPHCSQSYLYQALLRVESQWFRLSQGSTFTAINSNDLRSLPIELPEEIAEQEAIAEVLCIADRQVEILESKLAALYRLRKGLMQKLLSGELSVKTS